MRLKHLFLITLLFTLPTFACTNDLCLSEVWARTGKKHKTSAIYFNANNNTNKDWELINASTSVARMTEIHKTVTENGVSQMVHIDRLVIPAEKTILFKPKGLHIMLMGLKENLKSGDEFDLELRFKNLETKTYKVKVK